MRKAAVIGNAGGGKTALCETIQRIHNLPYHSIDHIQWRENWTRVPREEAVDTITDIIDEDQWIIDGWGAMETIEERFKRSDTIVLVDLPLHIHLWWAFKRQILAWIRPELVKIQKNCPLRGQTISVLKTVYQVNGDALPKLRKLVSKYSGSTQIYHLKSKRALKKFLLDQKLS